MDNIFEGVKFGDKFKTRDNRLAIYLSTEYGGHVDDKDNPPFAIVYCAVEYHIKYKDGGEKYFHNVEKYNENGKWNKWNPEDDNLDIVSKWGESIDEEKLNNLADEYVEGRWDIESIKSRIDFKAGYFKAKTE